ncbi:MAG: glucose-1-phosphate cytidylyltransferase [Candidatus Latescibacterota bacterium]
MKVVLFCGGLGMRLRDYSEQIPKPMVPIGYRPVLWHVMRYYAYYGHRDFILCLGYRADVIKEYFLQYNECISSDFVLQMRGAEVQLLNRDVEDWRITFVDTGTSTCIGQRLRAVAPYLEGEEQFLANYSDGLTDLPLPLLQAHFESQGWVGSFLSIRPPQSFHVVEFAQGGTVSGIRDIARSGIWINGGYFVFRREIFDYLGPGEELVEQPFQRLIEAGLLGAYPYNGFWACMDTFKDKQRLDDLHARGDAPWEVWNRRPDAQARTANGNGVRIGGGAAAAAVLRASGEPLAPRWPVNGGNGEPPQEI